MPRIDASDPKLNTKKLQFYLNQDVVNFKIRQIESLCVFQCFEGWMDGWMDGWMEGWPRIAQRQKYAWQDYFICPFNFFETAFHI